jgi:fluoride ion exporter CrcB/FEX
MNFPWGMAKFPREKNTFPGEQCTFPEERPKFPKKTYVLNLFAIIIISYFYIWFYNLSLEMFQRELQLCS